MTNIDDIARILGGHEPLLLDASPLSHAAVALVLRETGQGPEVLFIERASHADDPWSGDLGFPGGKVEAGDAGPRRAAERETLEELGLDLRDANLLGRLSDIAGAHLPVRISCFVYRVGETGPFQLSEEVRDAFWVSLTTLRDPVRHGEAEVRFGGEIFSRPAIRLPVAGKPVLWGITYRLVIEFLRILEEAERA
jgi:8-oxo-dGTP pyrophosphatase MutT (NUDIX family)